MLCFRLLEGAEVDPSVVIYDPNYRLMIPVMLQGLLEGVGVDPSELIYDPSYRFMIPVMLQAVGGGGSGSQ